MSDEAYLGLALLCAVTAAGAVWWIVRGAKQDEEKEQSRHSTGGHREWTYSSPDPGNEYRVDADPAGDEPPDSGGGPAAKSR